jgi:hypothetical protein
MTDTTKKCSKCGEVKLLGDFYLRRSTGMYRSECKACGNKQTYVWKKLNNEATKASKRKTINKRLSHYKEMDRSKYERNKVHLLELNKLWREKNPHKGAIYHQKNRNSLTDGYVRSVIASSVGVPGSFIPKPLIDLKREQLKLTRLIKEKQK